MINHSSIPLNINKIISRFNKKGFEAYLVGGAVRDLLLDISPKDFDICTNATPNQIRHTFPKNSTVIGKRFKIVHIILDDEIYEVSTFRRKASKEELKINRQNHNDNNILWRDNYWGTLDEDASRRDFSVNALYYNPINKELKDPIDGLIDLRDKKIRCLGSPSKRFQEDPIRMLRALKLVAQYNFTLPSDIIIAIKENKKLFAFVAKRRLFEEIVKLTQKPYLSKMINLIYKYELLNYIMPQTPPNQIELYLQITKKYDAQFAEIRYSKSYALTVLAFPFIHYHITQNNQWQERWKNSSELEKNILSIIRKFYSPYILMKYNTVKIKDILISLQQLTNKKHKVKYYYYAKKLQNTVRSTVDNL